MDQNFEEEDEVIYDKTSLLRRSTTQPKSRRPGARGQQNQLWRVISLTLLFTTVGISLAIPGPTIKCFEHLTHSEDPLVSCLFAGRAGGILVASLLTHLLLDIVPADCLSVVGLFLLAVAHFLIPWSERVWWLVGSFTLQGATIGLTLSAALTLTRLLFGRRYQPYRHTFLFALAVGSALTPVLVMPFQLSPGEVGTPRLPALNVSQYGVRGRRDVHRQIETPDLPPLSEQSVRSADFVSPLFTSTASSPFPGNSSVSVSPLVSGDASSSLSPSTSHSNTSSSPQPTPPESSIFLSSSSVKTPSSAPNRSSVAIESLGSVKPIDVKAETQITSNETTSTKIPTAPDANLTSTSADMRAEVSPTTPNSTSTRTTSTLNSASTSTSTPTVTPTPSATSTSTAYPTTTMTPSPTPTSTPSSSTTLTPSLTPTSTPSPIPISMPTSPTMSPTSTPTPTSSPAAFIPFGPSGGGAIVETGDRPNRRRPPLPSWPTTPPSRRRPSMDDRYHRILNRISHLRPVQRIFIVLGVLSLVTCVLCLHLCCVCRRQGQLELAPAPGLSAAVATESPTLFGRRRLSYSDLAFLGAVLLLFLSICGLEVTLGNWLYPWAKSDLGWPALPCLLLTATFWAGTALGRLPLLAVSRCRGASGPCGVVAILLLLHLALAFAASLLLLLLGERAVWGGAALAGFGLGPFRGAIAHWLEQAFAPQELRWLSVLTLVATGVGEAILPVATAFALGAASPSRALFVAAVAASALGPPLFALVALMARLRPVSARAASIRAHAPLLDEDEEDEDEEGVIGGFAARGQGESDPEDAGFALRKLRNGSAATTAADTGPGTAAPAAPLLSLEAEEDELGLH